MTERGTKVGTQGKLGHPGIREEVLLQDLGRDGPEVIPEVLCGLPMRGRYPQIFVWVELKKLSSGGSFRIVEEVEWSVKMFGQPVGCR